MPSSKSDTPTRLRGGFCAGALHWHYPNRPARMLLVCVDRSTRSMAGWEDGVSAVPVISRPLSWLRGGGALRFTGVGRGHR